MEKKKRFFLDKKYLLFMSFFLFIDLITKSIFQKQISPLFETSFFTILFSKNYGSSFSLFSNIPFYSYIIIALSILILSYIIIYMRENSNSFSKIKQFGFLLFIVGILGNLYDRILFGYVRDFLFLKGFFIFNFADVYLNLGVILIFISEIKIKKNIKKKGD